MLSKKVPPNLTITPTAERKTRIPSSKEGGKPVPKEEEPPKEEKPETINLLTLYQMLKDVATGQTATNKLAEENAKIVKETNEKDVKLN